MKYSIKFFVFALFAVFFTQQAVAQTTKYKCMIQMQNYSGKEAYVIISLINSKGQYEKTLGVLGPDQEWYNTLKEWDKFREKKKEKLNGIRVAQKQGGKKATRYMEFDPEK